MNTDIFNYELPEELIADNPSERGTGKMMILDRGKKSVVHSDFTMTCQSPPERAFSKRNSTLPPLALRPKIRAGITFVELNTTVVFSSM